MSKFEKPLKITAPYSSNHGPLNGVFFYLNSSFNSSLKIPFKHPQLRSPVIHPQLSIHIYFAKHPVYAPQLGSTVTFP